MDVKNYISSGILERFALGEVSKQEEQEVACLSKIYPEIKEELLTYQSVIEKMVAKYAVAPPADLKSKIMQEVKNTAQENADSKEANEADEKIIPINRANQKVEASRNMYKYLAVAASVGMFLLLGGGFYLNNQNVELKETLASNESTIVELKEEYNQMASTNEAINQQFALVTNSNTSKISMKGTELQPTSLANIFVSEENENIYLQVSNLPELSPDNDYQLWAIVEGQPRSLGVFNTENKKDLLEMKFIAKAEAFAVTLEPKGGSESPTLEKMYVFGAV